MRVRRFLPALAAALVFVAASAVAQEPDREHPDLKAAREQYLTESRDALAPVQKRHRERLDVMQKVLAAKGDRAAAAAVKAELDQLDPSTNDRSPLPLVGSWEVHYEGGAIRKYAIRADGTVLFIETQQLGRVNRVGDDWMLDFGDNKLERLKRIPAIQVEHFNPKELYLKGEKAERMGFAQKMK